MKNKIGSLILEVKFKNWFFLFILKKYEKKYENPNKETLFYPCKKCNNLKINKNPKLFL